MRIISPASRTMQQRALAAHELLDGGVPSPEVHSAFRGFGGPAALDPALSGLRPLVKDSWLRSLSLRPDPDRAAAPVGFGDDELARRRREHPLAAALPVFERLLVQPIRDTGLLMAIGDESGRLLWVDGDAAARRRAERMAFRPGADWSEQAVGTSAPGTALAVGAGVQISGAEHFSRRAHSFSCTAVPIRCPETGRILGVVDLTGDEDAVAPHTLALLQAAVAAAEAQLRIIQLSAGAGPGLSDATGSGASASSARSGATVRPDRSLQPLHLRVTGHAPPRAGTDASTEVGLRHAEILTLLAWHPHGLASDGLVELLYPAPGATDAGTLRAEMVRLRKAMAGVDPLLVPASRPYRLGAGIRTDAHEVLDAIDCGDHPAALAAYGGPVLPRSEAPGIEAVRSRVSASLRQAMLEDAGVDTLLEYLRLPEAEHDAEGWLTALRLLPARSPKRAGVVARLERLDAESA